MERATRADATSAAERGVPAEVVPTGTPDEGLHDHGLGLPQIRAAMAPVPVPSLDLPLDPPLPVTAVRPRTVGAEPARPVAAAFPPGVSAKLGTYVYLLIDPRTGRPFFAGTGRGDRCHRHVQAARSLALQDSTASKYPLLERIREAESDGRNVRVEVLRYGLTPAEADLVQTSVVDALALGHAGNLGTQRGPASDVGAVLAKRAKIKRSHPVVLLRAGPHGTPTPYEPVRHSWRIGQRWVDTASPRSPRWAMVVAGDLVDAVYRIDHWEPTPPAAGSGAGRFSLVGDPDVDLASRYVGRNVSAYLGSGAPSAVTYVWCGPHWVNPAT